MWSGRCRRTCCLHNQDKSTLMRDMKYRYLIHSFHWHVQNAMIRCRSPELLPFLSIIYPFLPPFSTNHPPSLHLAIYFLVYLSASLFPNLYIILFWEFLFPSILCTSPNHRNLFNLIASVIVGCLQIPANLELQKGSKQQEDDRSHHLKEMSGPPRCWPQVLWCRIHYIAHS